MDDRDVPVDLNGTLAVHDRVSCDDGVAVVDLAQVAELLDRELYGAPAVGVEALAEEGNWARVVDYVSDGGEEPLVCPSEDILVRARCPFCVHALPLPGIGSLNRRNVALGTCVS